jgi:hypothetical protein
LVVLPARGLACGEPGALQADEPVAVKEGNWPAQMIGAVRAGNPLPLLLLAQDAPQPAADPAVEDAEYRALAVLEIVNPATQRQSSGLRHNTTKSSA